MLNREAIAAIYARRLSLEDPRAVSDADEVWSYVQALLTAQRDARILDAGCGDGRYARHLARLGYAHVTAVDLFDRVRTDGTFQYRRGSIDALPLPDESVDFVYCLSAIFYLADPRTGMREMYRVMTPDAVVVLSAHTKYSLFTLDRVIRRACGGAEHLRGVTFYSADQYANMLVLEGFEVVDVDGYDLLYLPGNVLRQALARLRRLGVFARRRARNAPAPRPPRGSSPGWLKRTRAIFGYHSLIAARKRTAPGPRHGRVR